MRRCWRIPRGSEGTFGPDLLVKREKGRSLAENEGTRHTGQSAYAGPTGLLGGAKMAEEAGLPEVGPRK